MTHFVAEDLEYKIKLSSPVTKKGGKSKLLFQSNIIVYEYLYRHTTITGSFEEWYSEHIIPTDTGASVHPGGLNTAQ